MDKFLSDQRVLVFTAALLMALSGWIADYSTWDAILSPHSISGLFGLVGGVLLANVTHSIVNKPPTITETTEPKTSTKIIETTQPEVPPKAE